MGQLKDSLLRRLDDRANGRWPQVVERAKDPVKWEVGYWRLLGIVGEGREIARQISASPTVKEFGECVFAVFSPTGESIGFSRGILLHMASMGSAIEWMLQNDYEEDPGFHEGDVFFNNDPQIGGAHSADQATILPVFHEGELVCWVAGLTHCMETGSTEAGGMAPSALSRYDDGQMVPCQKVGANDKYYRDFHIMVSRNVRDGKWWIMDDKARMAGLLKMKSSILGLIDELGMDYFKTLQLEMLEEGRRAAIRKTRQVLFPGRYRTPSFYDINLKHPLQRTRIPRDYIAHLPAEMTVGADGFMVIDFEGVSTPGRHSNNGSWACTLGNHIYTLLQDVWYDGMFNNGMVDSFSLRIPENSSNACGKEYACSCWALSAMSVAGALTRNLGMAYYPMGFREEGFAAKADTGAMFAGGVDHHGNVFSIVNFEQSCSGMGAGSNADGLSASNAAWNPETHLADCEMMEHTWPLMWLGRGYWKDAGGFGRKRGGSPIESLYVVEHGVKDVESGSFASLDRILGWGMMGGYPACGRYKYALVNTNYKELVAQQKPLPHREGDDPENPDFARLMEGELRRYPAQMGADMFRSYDIIHHAAGGGGGWGDPIERKPEDVIQDLIMDFTAVHSAENVYCVVWDRETMEVDLAATEAKRAARRKERLARGIPAEEFLKAEREKILKGELYITAKETYNDCFRSERFLKYYKEYWKLGDDFAGFAEEK
jgi:acetone carboxylase, alpha subunit